MSPAAHDSSSVATEDNTLKREQGRYCSGWIEWMSDFVCVGNDRPRTNKNRPEEPKLLVLKGTEHVFLGCQGNMVIDVSVAHWKRNISQYMFTGQMKRSLRPTIPAEKVIVMESRDDEPTAKEEISSRNDMQHGSPARQKAIGFEIRPFEDVNEENENVSGHLSELESVIILLESRRFQLALNTLSNMLMSDTRQFGEKSLQVALHLHNIALLHIACGNLSDALYPFQDALEIKKEMLGLSHPSTIVGNETFFCSLNRFVSIAKTHSALSPVVYFLAQESHQQLAIALLAHGETERAKEMFVELSSICKASRDEFGVVRCWNALGCIHYINGSIDQAEYHFGLAISSLLWRNRRAWHSRDMKIGLAICKSNLGSVQLSQRMPEAVSTLLDAHRVSEYLELFSKRMMVAVSSRLTRLCVYRCCLVSARPFEKRR